MSKHNWKNQQKFAANAFRLVTNADRPAPPEFPDGVPADIVVKHLGMENAVKYRPSQFLPEAKSGYGFSSKWKVLQKHLVGLSKVNYEAPIFNIISSRNLEGLNSIMLLKDLSKVMFELEIFKHEFSLVFGKEFLSLVHKLPKNPVKDGYEQCTGYTKMEKLINYNFFPVVVWHCDKTRFENDLCFFSFTHFLKICVGYNKYDLNVQFFDKDIDLKLKSKEFMGMDFFIPGVHN